MRRLIFAALFLPLFANATELPDGGLESSSWAIAGQHNYTTTPSEVRTGAQALRMVANGVTQTSFHPIIPMAPGTDYCLTVFAAADGLVATGPGETPIAGVQHRTATNGKVDDHNGSSTDGFRWAPFETDGTFGYTDAGMTQCGQMKSSPIPAAALRVFGRTWANQTAGVAFFDDFEVTLRSFPDRGALVATLQAEDLTSSGATFHATEHDFTGTGYMEVDDPDLAADFEWTATQTGDFVFSTRYTREGRRVDVNLYVDNVQVDGANNITPTGRKYIYSAVDLKASVAVGQTVRVEVTRKENAGLSNPLIDRIDVFEDLNPPTPPPPVTPDIKFSSLIMCGAVQYIQCAPILAGSVTNETSNSVELSLISDQPVAVNEELNAYYYRVLPVGAPLPSGQSLREDDPQRCGSGACVVSGLPEGSDIDIAVVHFTDFRYSAVIRLSGTTTGSPPPLASFPACSAVDIAAAQAAPIDPVLASNGFPSASRPYTYPDTVGDALPELTLAQSQEISLKGGQIPIEWTDIEVGLNPSDPVVNGQRLNKWLRYAWENKVGLDLHNAEIVVDGQVWINRMNSRQAAGCTSSSAHDTTGEVTGDPDQHAKIILVDNPTAVDFSDPSNPQPFVALTTSSGDPFPELACNLGGGVNRLVSFAGTNFRAAPANGFGQRLRHVDIITGSGVSNNKRGLVALSAHLAQHSHIYDVDITVDRVLACLGRGPGRGGLYSDVSCTNLSDDSQFGYNDRLSVAGDQVNQVGATGGALRDVRFNGTWTSAVMVNSDRVGLYAIGIEVNDFDLTVAAPFNNNSSLLPRSASGSITMTDVVFNATPNSAAAVNPFPVIDNQLNGGRTVVIESLWANGVGDGKPLFRHGSDVTLHDASNPHVVRHAFAHPDSASQPTASGASKYLYTSLPINANIVDGVAVAPVVVHEVDNEATPADVGKFWSQRFNDVPYPYYRRSTTFNFTYHGCLTNKGSVDLTADVQTMLDEKYLEGVREFMFSPGVFQIGTLNIPADAQLVGSSSRMTFIAPRADNPALTPGGYMFTTDADVNGTCSLQDMQLVPNVTAAAPDTKYVDWGCGRGVQRGVRGAHFPSGKNSQNLVQTDGVFWNINATGGGFMAVSDLQRADRPTFNSTPMRIANSECAPFSMIINSEHFDSESSLILDGACNVTSGNNKNENNTGLFTMRNSQNIMLAVPSGIGTSAHRALAHGALRVEDSEDYLINAITPYTVANFEAQGGRWDNSQFTEVRNGSVFIERPYSVFGPENYAFIKRGNFVLDDARLR